MGVGFVLRFEVATEYAEKFEVKVVGGREHQELWVPAEELEEFNRNIVGEIQVTKWFKSESTELAIDPETQLPVEWISK